MTNTILKEIQTTLTNVFVPNNEQAQVITTDANNRHLQVTIITSKQYDTPQKLVALHQKVYSVLNEYITNDSIHAVEIIAKSHE